MKATVRHAARVILVNSQDEVLLFRAVFRAWGDGDKPRSFWIAPGGGVDDGEDHESAARREAWEEVGLRDAPIGPCCWLRSQTFRFGEGQIEQREQYFLCRVESHTVSSDGFQEGEADFLVEHRWWTPAAMRASDQRFVPANFADLLEAILMEGPPSGPIVVGI